jgi:hypothetical protein
VIVKGQCTLDMKNKVESLKGHDLIEEIMMSSARQQGNKPLAEYYKRFTSCVDVWDNPNGGPQCQRQQQRMKRMRKRQETSL